MVVWILERSDCVRSVAIHSRHTFLLSVRRSCWPSSSALHLPGHHRGPCPLRQGHLPAKKGMGTEGAVPQCKTKFAGHGAHRSDREQPEHSSEREKTVFEMLITLEIDISSNKRFISLTSVSGQSLSLVGCTRVITVIIIR